MEGLELNHNGYINSFYDICMNCKIIDDLSAINFCDGTYIGPGSSFDISTNQVLKIIGNSGINMVINEKGSVGINTSDPSSNYSLDIHRKAGSSGTLILTGNSALTGNPKLLFYDTNSNNSGLVEFNDEPNSFSLNRTTYITQSDASNDIFNVQNDQQVNIVGDICGSIPIAYFNVRQVDSSGTPMGAIRGLEIGAPAGGVVAPVYLKVNGTSNDFRILDNTNNNNLTIKEGGNIGIGTQNNSINNKLQIHNFSDNTTITDSGYTIAAGTSNYGILLEISGNFGNNAALWLKNDTPSASNTNLFRVNNNGRVGINTINSTQGLDIDFNNSVIAKSNSINNGIYGMLNRFQTVNTSTTFGSPITIFEFKNLDGTEISKRAISGTFHISVTTEPVGTIKMSTVMYSINTVGLGPTSAQLNIIGSRADRGTVPSTFTVSMTSGGTSDALVLQLTLSYPSNPDSFDVCTGFIGMASNT
jgi:hypothetical protein